MENLELLPGSQYHKNKFRNNMLIRHFEVSYIEHGQVYVVTISVYGNQEDALIKFNSDFPENSPLSCTEINV